MLSACIKVHIFCSSNILQHVYILHRKYCNLTIFIAFISSLLAILIGENAKRNQFYLFYHLLFYHFIMSPSVCYLVFLVTELTSSFFCTTTHVIAGSSVSLLLWQIRLHGYKVQMSTLLIGTPTFHCLCWYLALLMSEPSCKRPNTPSLQPGNKLIECYPSKLITS